MKTLNIKHFTIDLIPKIILYSFIVLVPLARCKLFFDSYEIKLWIVQIGISIVLVFCFVRNYFLKNDIYVLCLLAAYLLFNFFSWTCTPYPFKYVALPTLSLLVTYIILCLLVAQYSLKLDKVIMLWLITAVLNVFYAIYQFNAGESIVGVLGNDNYLASYILLTILISGGYFTRIIIDKNDSVKKFMIIGISIILLFLFCTGIYITHSRGAWIGLGAGLLSFFILSLVAQGKRFIFTVAVIIVVIILISMPAVSDFVNKQFQGDVRPAIWKSTLHMIGARPWLGWGKGAYFIYYPQFRITDYWLSSHPKNLTIHAHNEYLQILAETGVIGLVVFMILIFLIIGIGIKKINNLANQSQRFLMIGLVSGVIGMLVHNFVCNNLQFYANAIFLWFMLGLVFGSGVPIEYRSAKKSNKLLLFALTLIAVIILWQVSIKTIIFQYRFKEGSDFSGEKNWAKAINSYLSAIEMNPWNVEIQYRLAYAYALSGQLKKAIERYEDVIAIAPDYGDTHRNMGIIYSKMNEPLMARQHLIKARQRNPYDQIAVYYLNVLGESNDS